VWNVDETGKKGVEGGLTKVVAPKGAKNVYHRGVPKGKHVTLVGKYFCNRREGGRGKRRVDREEQKGGGNKGVEDIIIH
jgi:hypothetical protein